DAVDTSRVSGQQGVGHVRPVSCAANHSYPDYCAITKALCAQEDVMMAVQPFTVHVPEEALADLRERLARTRWPDELSGAAWDYGSNLAYLKELIEYLPDQLFRRCPEGPLNLLAAVSH